MIPIALECTCTNKRAIFPRISSEGRHKSKNTERKKVKKKSFLSASCEQLPVVQRIRLLPILPQSQRRLLGESVRLHLSALCILRSSPHPNLTAHLIRTDVFLVLVDDRTTEAAFQDDDGRQDEAGSDLNERDVRLARNALETLLLLLVLLPVRLLLAGLCFSDLVDPDPDLAVNTEDADDSVDKRLHALHPPLRHAKDAPKHFPDQRAVFRARLPHCRPVLVEGAIKHHNASATLEAVSSEACAQFTHRVQVGNGKFNGRAVWRPGNPEIQVLAALLGFEKEDHVTRVKICEGVEEQVVASVLLPGIELALFEGMRKEGTDVGKEMPVTRKRV